MRRTPGAFHVKRMFAFLLAPLLLLPYGCAPAQPLERTFFAMDTVMTLRLYEGGDENTLDQAEARVRELEAQWSVTEENSEICALNRGGRAELSPETAELLGAALDMCRRTDGALDISTYPVLRAWGFTTGEYSVPGGEAIAALLPLVDYGRVALEAGAAALPPGMEIDLGSVAKGYTGDALAALLKQGGAASALLDLGGNIQAVGSKPDGSPWRVALQAPEGGYAGVLEIVDKAVVTSGGYQRFFEQDGEIYWHIIDPAAGRPARSGLASVTIVAEEGTLCDGLSTALFVMGADRAAEFWRETGDFDFVLLDEEGGVTITEGLEDSFSLCGEWAGRPLEVLRR